MPRGADTHPLLANTGRPCAAATYCLYPMPALMHPFGARHRPSRACNGFTLVELLTVIAIIGVLAALVIGGMGQVRSKARAAECLGNLRQLGLSTILFSQTNQGKLPGVAAPRWDAAALQTLSGVNPAPYSNLLRCPSDLIERTTANPAEVRSYASNPTLFNFNGQFANTTTWGANPPAANVGMTLNALSNPSRTVLLLERHDALNTYNSGSWLASGSIYNAHDGGMNVVYADGHAARIATSLEVSTFQRQHLSRGP